MDRSLRAGVAGALAPYAVGFRDELLCLGYSPRSAQTHLLLMRRLSIWLGETGVEPGALTVERIEQFLTASRAQRHRFPKSSRGAELLIGFLRRGGVVPGAPAVVLTAAGEIVEQFRRYLVTERGLRAGTITNYLHVARLFLQEVGDVGLADLACLEASQVQRFVLAESSRRSVASTKTVVTGLRSLLRFCHVVGFTATPLVGAVPTVSGWTGTWLPHAVDASTVTRMLASCDRRSAQGCRDYAVLVVLTRLGMRVGEVAAVEFDDIDWHRGELMVRGKAKRFERLPLAVDVGQALADYIQHARPTSSDRKLFLRVVAPHRGLTTGGLIMIVRSACRRAGIEPVAAHRLRHTVASELLRAGAGLSEIGQLLRHRSIASTAIYAFLLRFAAEHAGKAPSQLDLVDLDAPLIGAFLDHLEHDRHNSVRTRNNRLVAVHSLFGFAALREPSHAEHIQRVLAIPQKRFERAIVSFLNRGEIDAILASPDTATWIGRRDRALLLTVIQTGLRVSELTGVRRRDVVLAHGPHVYCRGKGRKERCTPLTAQTVTVLRSWLQERDGDPDAPLFPSRRGDRLSIDAVERLVDKYVNRAARGCPSLDDKRVTPHVLRHSTAMELLAASVDSSVIALWLGHESLQSTQMYLHADMAIKQRALDRTAPHADAVGRYQPPDALIAYLDSL